MKRILDCHASDFQYMGRRELLDAIAGAEGRTIACETIGSIMPMLGDISNAEFAAAMGADILINDSTAIVSGQEKLKGAQVKAQDLRAGAALVIAGLIAEGTTEVQNIQVIERGYECLVEKLSALGADIRKVED